MAGPISATTIRRRRRWRNKGLPYMKKRKDELDHASCNKDRWGKCRCYAAGYREATRNKSTARVMDRFVEYAKRGVTSDDFRGMV